MYLPPQFKAKERSQALDIMRAHPLASLISVDDAGLPFISHLPLHVEERGDALVLFGHCDAHAKDQLLKQLIDDHDPAYAAQWRALAPDYQQKMLSAITAFELQVLDLQCKVKLNQHRPESHVRMHAIYAAGNAEERALADWMVRLGFDVPAPVLPA